MTNELEKRYKKNEKFLYELQNDVEQMSAPFLLGLNVKLGNLDKTFTGINIMPINEKERLKALYRYRLLENLPKGYFTNLAHIMALTFDTPIALVSLVDKETVLFPGNVGMEHTNKVQRDVSLCSLAILDDQPTVFTDALREPCLLTNPLVSGAFGLRFYAGAPILTHDGYAIGTVCIVDMEPRDFTEQDQELLKGFARNAMQEIELRLKTLITQVE